MDTLPPMEPNALTGDQIFWLTAIWFLSAALCWTLYDLFFGKRDET